MTSCGHVSDLSDSPSVAGPCCVHVCARVPMAKSCRKLSVKAVENYSFLHL